MSWPVILSGVVCVAMLALGFNLLLPLGSGLARVVYSAEFAVKIGRLDVQVRQRGRGAWIFVSPVEAGPG